MTTHGFICGNSLDAEINKNIDLILTSPPYPMIEMWDQCFVEQNPEIADHLAKGNGIIAWTLMTKVLEEIITKSTTYLNPGGFLIINIGDATRTLNNFALYPTHSLLDYHCVKTLGLTRLPCILWSKPSNKPNKYMGSGMLPGGAYATLEHEYILIYRKGNKREFDKENRRKSAFFWEERNKWFSDNWSILGANQKLNLVREKSAAFPHELAYRLIAMYTCYDDVVLDPFSGIGTTCLAAMHLNRNSIGIESHRLLVDQSLKRLLASKDFCNGYTRERLTRHIQFVNHSNKKHIHINKHYGFKVMTKHEESIIFKEITEIQQSEDSILCNAIDMNP
jgi:DNA modification methylase